MTILAARNSAAFFTDCASTTLAEAFGHACLAALFALVCTAPALAATVGTAAVAVTPLSEQVLASSIADTYAPLHGQLLSEDEWRRYSKRPSAFGEAMSVAHNTPNGATGYARDPAYMPVLPLTESKQGAKSKKNPAKTPAAASIHSPTVPAPYAPVVKAPKVASPKTPTAASPTVTSPTVPVAESPYTSSAAPTGPIAEPTVASPTAPSAPSAPVVANPAATNAGGTNSASNNGAGAESPSLADQPNAQDGLMSTGRGIMSDMASSANGGGTATAGTATGGTSNATTAMNRNGKEVLRGAASSLVVPPTGISLSPNNGAGALTSPANPQ